MSAPDRIAILGGGAMGEAFARGLLGAGIVSAGRLRVADRHETRRTHFAKALGVETHDAPAVAVADADVAIVAVKPRSVAGLAAELDGALRSVSLVITIVAGLDLDRAAEKFQTRSLCRAMPNTPVQVGAGVIAYFPMPGLGARECEWAETILRAVGSAVLMEVEGDLDAATALSGSGPAYVLLFLEAMIDAGVHAGLPRAIARDLALGTIEGTGTLARRSGQHPALLRDAVTSPGGTTAAGLAELEAGRLRTAVNRAILAAMARSRELGRGPS
ncbi:MAG: pyrroline-5-carboxylate reductase [Chloroflexi bacterium]|nr:pyrroline-5-carboxylate reductase [Chloroflexota bacterium]